MVFINSLRSLHFIYQSFENVFGITKVFNLTHYLKNLK